MSEHTALARLIQKARQRHTAHILLGATLFAAAVALGGLVAMLLFGTQWLNGYVPALLFALALAAALYRAKNHFWSRYQLAQTVDRHLGLYDKLSTAVYFEDGGTSSAPRGVVEQQKESAEEAARTADLKTGLPFHAPKSLYAGGALALVAASLFAVRYGATRSLDLHTSLVQIAFNSLLGSEDVAAAKKKGAPAKPGGEKPKENALNVDPWESKAMDAQGPPDNALNTVDTPGRKQSQQQHRREREGERHAGERLGSPAGRGDRRKATNLRRGRIRTPRTPRRRRTRMAASRASSKAASSRIRTANSSGENSSLADKMRDAISNLMSKLKQQKPSEGKQGSQQSQQGQQSAQKQGKEDKGGQQSGKQSDAMSSPDQQGDQEGQSSDKAASAQNKSGSKSADKPQSQDGKSGMGKEDGDKSAREAEQLAAMGKISEIIGKRAANMTGEVMVEVSSGKQQLKTQYSQRKASHADAGGEINRDEVPLAYQQFVQQYFEEIRKAPAAAPAAKAKKRIGLVGMLAVSLALFFFATADPFQSAVAHYNHREYAKAAEEFQQILKTEPADTPTYRQSTLFLAQSLYLNNQFKDAIPYLEKAAAAGEKALEANYMLGNAHIQLHETEAAAKAFAGLFGVAADSASAYLLTAQMMIRRGFEEDAEQAAKHALELNPLLPQRPFFAGRDHDSAWRSRPRHCRTDQRDPAKSQLRYGLLSAGRRSYPPRAVGRGDSTARKINLAESRLQRPLYSARQRLPAPQGFGEMRRTC